MTALSAWLLLGGFIASALMLALALVIVQRAPASAWAGRKKSAAPDLQLVSADEQPAASELRKQLYQAGFQHPAAVRLFLYAKAGCALAGLIAGLILIRLVPALEELAPPFRLGVMLIVCVMGYFLPVVVIDKRRAAYMKRIELALPDALDFMLICVEAGQSTDMAVMRVADELRPVHPDLAARFTALTEALAAGAERQDSWLKMAQETDNDDLRQLASVIVQSTSMGTPIAQTLRVFAADLRDRRVRKIEERANVLPTKMTLGTMMFTVPPLLILLLAPAVYRIATSF
ncbi:type II secretion system F family protein [Pseudogemmobacter humi]|uniref:Bacterial type II secretion system protein F domain protein n=1 Tax=Pseudogemmobacter humi TaxID=2483812 RepID=A0A3P5WK00_9RHOB|nr:type II secretion system F family protein [Pseudogemmobacter humi]VDC21152.1 Bacterial type II secretion system protein F domain protein [Pseudogemmobacter humi]